MSNSTLILFLVICKYCNGFTVDVFNITLCKFSDEEIGDMISEKISLENSPDQLYSAKFSIPVDLGGDSFVEFVSHAWDAEHEDWLFLFYGVRSSCNSIVTSLPYRKFRESIDPNWPMHCPIPAGIYELNEFPISGQYVVLSDIRNGYPVTKHKVKLWAGDDVVFCREVYTISST